MIFALGKIVRIRPRCSQLLGILSMKKGFDSLTPKRRTPDIAFAELHSSVRRQGGEVGEIVGLPSKAARFSPASQLAIPMMSGSSIVPSTSEWLARICSIRVDPARGIPSTKIGSESVESGVFTCPEEIAVQ